MYAISTLILSNLKSQNVSGSPRKTLVSPSRKVSHLPFTTPLINRAGGLYRSCVQTSLRSVCTHDLGQDSPIQTDLARLIRCLLYGKEENFNSFNLVGLLTFCLQTKMSLTPLNLNLLKFALPLYFFSFCHQAFWHSHKWLRRNRSRNYGSWKKIKENGEHFCILVCYFFNAKWNRSRCRSRWENLTRGQYRFQPIKFVNSVLPSPCETQPYNKRIILNTKAPIWL